MTKDCVSRRPDVVTVELVGGTEKRPLELVVYDDSWPVIFQDHQRRLRKVLGTTGLEVEHIGSTSVPGLAAKPIVDILVTVGDITAEEDYLAPLLSVGYELRVREPGHRLVRTSARDVHIHILQRGDEAIDRYVLFRNRLRADAADRSLYEAMKSALLAEGFDDMNAYADAKTEVIAAIIARALASGA
ncbi:MULTISPECIES: GrpB family protein [unclassified Cryobacterium]|uniref:GrpB family protein n=1 Tax=unclassified Cryobacterium TaxID=2649013 RepID=UPI002AB53A34|nr:MULTISPECIES: GrpB family protein [unclassified Cryobacterium]MDY7541331.1 GrpB family protein [Cryobacterium sp. 5B3]MEB0265321.1 GrpB family protein [Cryobacterium sp. 10I5]MEB0273370.1 GrpB family protein [Cryobacterium sp. 5B3]